MKKSKRIKIKINNKSTQLSLLNLGILFSLKRERLVLDELIKKIEKIEKELPLFEEFFEEIKEVTEPTLRTIVWRLKKRGFIRQKGKEYYLSAFGLEVIETIKIEQKRKWDKKWRLVIFDIPESLRKERDWLRQELYLAKYRPIQKSVFVGKFPLEKEVFDQIKKKLKNYVKIITLKEFSKEEF